jgi:hypothetical protein
MTAVAVVTAAVTVAIRAYVIEPQHLHLECTTNPDTPFCGLRQALIVGFVWNVYSLTSLALGVLAIALRSRACAWGAIVLGIVGALLYRIEFAALGLLLGALAAARPPVTPHHRERHP